MKALVLVALMVILAIHANPENDDEEWENFKITHKRNFKTPEKEKVRKALFLKTLKHVQNWNENFQRGEVTWKQEMTHLADRTLEERKKFIEEMKALHKQSKLEAQKLLKKNDTLTT